MNTCVYCGKEVADDATSCSECKRTVQVPNVPPAFSLSLGLVKGLRSKRRFAQKHHQETAAVLVLAVILPLVLGIGGSPSPTPALSATVTITPQSQQVSNTFSISGVTGTPGEQQVQARVITQTTPTYSKTVPATGHVTTSETNAIGQIYISTSPQVGFFFSAGSFFPCTNLCDSTTASLHIVLDQSVSVSGGSTIIAAAHIQEGGAVGNAVNNTNFEYQSNFYSVYPAGSFTGGTDSQSYTYVQQSDIDNAANALITANQPDPQQFLQGQVQANERFVGQPGCTPNQSSDQQVGAQATTVTVYVSFTCTGEVYDYDGALSLAAQMLRNQAASSPGTPYALTGQIVTTWQNATLNGQTATVTVAAQGIWVYQISSEQQQAWASLIAGQSPQTARATLAGLAGIAHLSIQLTGANAQVLPVDPANIIIVVQSVQGF